MPKNTQKIPTDKEIKKLLQGLIRSLDYEAVNPDRAVKDKATRLQDYRDLRDLTAIKLRKKILDEDMQGSASLTLVLERLDDAIDRLDDSKSAHDKSLTISWQNG